MVPPFEASTMARMVVGADFAAMAMLPGEVVEPLPVVPPG